MLTELQREFAPLLRIRGWVVDELVEMCCCSERGGGVQRSSSIHGMCHCAARGRRASRIEIRLREPCAHAQFMDYENYIVGTMCHELAHIVHGNHSADFYKLMENLRTQFDETRVLAGADGRGTFAGEGQKADPNRHNPPADPRIARRLGAAAAEKRMQRARLMGPPGGCRLGGGGTTNGATSAPSWRHMNPREAAAAAAERRRRDDSWCHRERSVSSAVPLQESTKADSSNALSSRERGEPKAANKFSLSSANSLSGRKRQRPSSSSSVQGKEGGAAVVDLTSDDDDCGSSTSPCSGSGSTSTSAHGGDTATKDTEGDLGWQCPSCTLKNPPLALACGACLQERPCSFVL